MGGSFSIKRFLDPLGLTFGKGQPGSVLDPANLFGKDNSQADAIKSAPVPTPADPAAAASAATLNAEHDFAMRNMLKKSVRKTIVAGDTGGYSSSNPLGSGGAAQGYKAKLG